MSCLGLGCTSSSSKSPVVNKTSWKREIAQEKEIFFKKLNQVGTITSAFPTSVENFQKIKKATCIQQLEDFCSNKLPKIWEIVNQNRELYTDFFGGNIEDLWDNEYRENISKETQISRLFKDLYPNLQRGVRDDKIHQRIEELKENTFVIPPVLYKKYKKWFDIEDISKKRKFLIFIETNEKCIELISIFQDSLNQTKNDDVKCGLYETLTKDLFKGNFFTNDNILGKKITAFTFRAKNIPKSTKRKVSKRKVSKRKVSKRKAKSPKRRKSLRL